MVYRSFALSALRVNISHNTAPHGTRGLLRIIRILGISLLVPRNDFAGKGMASVMKGEPRETGVRYQGNQAKNHRRSPSLGPLYILFSLATSAAY